MPIYVVEIAGRGLAAFDAADDTEAAEVRLTDRAFRRDLIVFQNEGRPLWDGVSEIRMREASPEEAVQWESGMLAAGKDRFVFLVAVVDPSDRDDDDDDDYDNDPD